MIDELGGLLSILGTLLNAYEEGKRIDLQREAMMANYRIEKGKLELQKDALDKEYKKVMKKIEVEEEFFFEQLAEKRSFMKNNIARQDQMMEMIRIY